MNSLTDIMTTNVLSVKADWSTDTLSQFFFDNLVSGAPVIDDNDKLIGVVSITDLARMNSPPLSNDSANATHDYYLNSKMNHNISQEDMSLLNIETESVSTVEDIMTPMVFEVDESTSIKNAADMMLKGHIHRLFVTRDKKIVGIVTTMDMLKLINELA